MPLEELNRLLLDSDDERAYRYLRKNGITTILAAETVLNGYACKERAISILEQKRCAGSKLKKKRQIIVPNTTLTIEDAVLRLETCRREYYSGGMSFLTDDEYDCLFNATRRLAPEHPFFKKAAKAREKKTKRIQLANQYIVPGNIPICQDKCTGAFDLSTTFEKVDRWMQKQGHDVSFFVTPLYRGVPCSLNYENGRLVWAAIYEKGQRGKDITHLIAATTIPKNLSGNLACEIHGMLVSRKNLLTKKTKHEITYKDLFHRIRTLTNPGKIRELELDFCASDLILNEKRFVLDEQEKFAILRRFGFEEAGELGIVSQKDIAKIQSYYLSLHSLKGLTFNEVSLRLVEVVAKDGIIITVNSKDKQLELYSQQKSTSIAIKFPIELVETTVLNVVWQAGQSGRLRPTLLIKPVVLDGEIVEQIQGETYRRLVRRQIGIGKTIIVGKGILAFPKVFGVNGYTPVVRFNIPDFCPSCGHPIVKKDEDPICINLHCKSRVLASILYFFRVVVGTVFGIHKGTIKLLYAHNVIKDVADFYRLDKRALIQIPGVGIEKTRSFLAAVEESKYVSVEKLLQALTRQEFKKRGAKKVISFLGRDGWKLLFPAALIYETATKLLRLGKAAVNINLLSDFFIWLLEPENQKRLLALQAAGIISLQKQPLSLCAQRQDLHVCITGQTSLPYKDLALLLEENGYCVDGGVKKTTQILVCNVINSCKKLKKAQKKGIEIVSETEMLARISGVLQNKRGLPLPSLEGLDDEFLWNRAVAITSIEETLMKKKKKMDVPNIAPLPMSHFEERIANND